ncbi:tyrosine--tRNA ligase, partial [Nitrospirillum viridazoti]
MDTQEFPRQTPRSTALQVLGARGYIHQCTNLDGLDAAFSAGVVPVYIGFDATADSLHVGHLLPIMTLRRLQRAGHKPIVLIGGGTTRVGDPSFRATERPLLSDEQITANIQGIRQVFERFLTFGSGPIDAVMVNNADWLDRLGYIDLLRDIGRHFSVNRMLSFDSVKARLERQDPMSFLEFNYMILQAFDFLELHRRAGCLAQMGGSDQWGNIVNGIDLVRRLEGREVFGLTTPLLTTASGTKMGKTASGAVWLNADRLSPYDYWQFWRNTEDADVGRFLRLFTDLPLERIAELEALPGAEINRAKEVLADAATALA